MLDSDEWVVSSADRTLRSGFSELFSSRAVLYALIRRELKSRFRASFLGFTWTLGRPIVMLLVYSLIIGEILGANRSLEYFAIYLFVGLMFWGFFAESVLVGTGSIVNATGLVQKVAFPREILPLTAVVIAAVNVLVQLPVLIVGYWIFNKWPDFKNFILLIPALGILFCIALGLGLLLSSINVYIRDIQPLTELSVTLLMYATPLLYAWTFVEEKAIQHFSSTTVFDVYVYNPIAMVLILIQDSLWPGQRFYSDGTVALNLFQIDSPAVWITLAISSLFLLISYKIFLKLEPNFAREL